MENNGKEFWEEYKQKLIATNDKWNYLDTLIYRFKKPENVPINIWLDKLNENPNYWEEYIESRFGVNNIIEYVEIDKSKNTIEVNIEDKLKDLKAHWKFLLYNLQSNHRQIWLMLLDSEPVLVSENIIHIEISDYSEKKIKAELGLDLADFEDESGKIISEILQKKYFTNYVGEPYKIRFKVQSKAKGFYWEELVANPQIPFPFKSDKNEATWEFTKKGIDKTLMLFESKIDRLQKRFDNVKQMKQEGTSNDTEQWITTPYEILKKLLDNKSEEIQDLPKEVFRKETPKSLRCKWGKRRKFLESKYCTNKPRIYDVFCDKHIEENDLVSQEVRERLIQTDIQSNPDINEDLIRMRYSYPSNEVVEFRKKLNFLSLSYYLGLYPELITREKQRLERWNLISNFYDALKPVYEKYYYLKFGRPTISMSQKLRIMKKTDFKCAICKAELTEKEPHIDHIIPLIKGGGNAESNLQALCWQCNLKKGSKIL